MHHNYTPTQKEKAEALGETFKAMIEQFEKEEGVNFVGLAMEFYTSLSMKFPRITSVSVTFK